MPILIVYGLPKELADDLNALTTALQSTVNSYPELGLNRQQVTVFYPADIRNEGLGKEVVIFVCGLFDLPQRTQEVRQAWASAIRDCMIGFARQHLPECKLIEVIGEPFDRQTGMFDSRIL